MSNPPLVDSFIVEPAAFPLMLIVDDQPANIQALYEIFKNDYEVCMATSGQQALNFCELRQPHIILLDVIMPGMDGYTVCHHLKADELTGNIPIIFITANNNPLEEVRALDEGAADFITKPFHARVVHARVHTQLTLKHQADLLRALALVDSLTGVANRRQFDAILETEWRRCARANHALSLIMIDVDFFKRYNDTYGHQAGDACLQAVASTIQNALHRSHDLVARYGGEEFACILPDTPIEGSIHKARLIEHAIRALAIPHSHSDVAPIVTISVGVAVASPAKGEDLAQLIAMADQQMYLAKTSGRGQVKYVQI